MGVQRLPPDQISLARGLIEFERLTRGDDTTPGGQTQPAAQFAQSPSSPVASPGAALDALLTGALAQRSALGAPELAAASQRLRARGAVSGADSPTMPFVIDVRAMNLVSHALEERVIEDRLACEVYAGFQRFALLTPQVRRYQAMLQSARYVFVYGIDDTQPGSPSAQLQHPRLYRFPIDLTRETGMERFWFVVLDDPRWQTALLARQMRGDLWAPHQSARAYQGVWTFDPALVGAILQALRQAARLFYHAPTAPQP
jgi:hypothetical protein